MSSFFIIIILPRKQINTYQFPQIKSYLSDAVDYMKTQIFYTWMLVLK